MKILGILEDIAKFALAAAASPATATVVSMINPTAGIILGAVAGTAAQIEKQIPSPSGLTAPVTPVDAAQISASKKTAFLQQIGPALEAATGKPVTLDQIALSSQTVDSLVTLANSLMKMGAAGPAGTAQNIGLGPTKVGG
jgi:hypothetical protein